MEKLAAIVLMDGLSTRFGGPKNKQLCLLNDKHVFNYAIETFAKLNNINELVIAVNQENKEEIEKFLEKTGIKARIVLGGISRQESVEHAISVLNLSEDDIVIIHDAARPNLYLDLIEQSFEGMIGYDGVLPVLPMKDTVYESADGQVITRLLERQHVYAGQAPEAFRYGKYLEAYRRLSPAQIASLHGSTEPAIMAGLDIAMLPGDENNYKITTPMDLKRYQQEA